MCGVLLFAVSSAAQTAPPASAPAVATACWLEKRLFRSLRTGVVDYCRGHLAYEPGALDCYQFADEACLVFIPESLTWTETRRPVLSPIVLPCPLAPEPPVCPRLGQLRQLTPWLPW